MGTSLRPYQDTQIKKLGIGRYAVVQDVAWDCLPYAAACAAVIAILWLRRLGDGRLMITLHFQFGKHRFKWKLLRPHRFFFRQLPAFLSALLLCTGLYCTAYTIQLPQYLNTQKQDSTIYMDEYVDPRTQNISFPTGNRNLIHIVMESMEMTCADQAHGGLWENNLIPNLSTLAEENISFSNMIDLSGSNFTSGGLTAQTAGLPLLHYSALPSAWTLSDILAEAGYCQIFMCGSDGDFGLRKPYYNQHQTEVWDLFTARELGKVAPDYKVGWGLEDYILYDNAKEILTDLAQNSTPFNLTLLTVDTHCYDGLRCKYCDSLYETQYENVFHCADHLVYDFIQWIQAQDFYENTTIVITGDHLCMDHGFFFQHDIEMSDRRIYNCILNPVEGLEPPTQERTLTGLDIFPTTLRAIGAEWDSSRLGLGVDLFSEDPTLVEKLGQQSLSIQVLADTEGAKVFY